MTTSRDPEKPSTGGKSSPRKGYRTPLGRRLRYLAQDTGYAVKKAGRRVADPMRDARGKRESEAKLAKAEKERKSAVAAEKAKPEPKAKREKPGRRERIGRKPRAGRRARAGREAGAEREPRTERKSRLRRPRPERKQRAKRRARRPRAPARRAGGRTRRRLRRPSGTQVATAITNFGERASKLVRGVLAPLAVPFIALAALGGRALRWLEREVTPLRAAVATTALAAILLGVSQFVDYRGVAVGVPDYAAYTDVDVVAPAPQVDREPAGSAHAYVLVPVALLAIGLLLLAARGRWQLGRIVSLLGIFGIAITLVVDRPAGLDASAQAIAYSGVEAQLVEGFYAQLFASAVLVAGGLLVSRYARSAPRRKTRSKRRAARVGAARARAA